MLESYRLSIETVVEIGRIEGRRSVRIAVAVVGVVRVGGRETVIGRRGEVYV